MRSDRGASRLVLLLALAVTSASLSSRAGAQAFEQQELVPGTTGIASFGLRLATDGDVLVGGAPTDDTAGTSAGGAYVWRRDGATGQWLFEQSLVASHPQNYAQFGLAVAVDGDVIAVAAPYYVVSSVGDTGCVYVFRRDPATGVWNEEQQLFAAAGLAGDRLGLSLAMSGDRIVAGTLYDDTAAGADAGSATIFHYQDAVVLWVEETTLFDPDGANTDYAGWDVAIDGTTILVGSPRSDENGFNRAGSVGIWNLVAGTWSQTQELLPSNVSDSKFGQSLALHGSQLLVGAPEEDDASGITKSGAAYLFTWNGVDWSEEHRFLPPAPVMDDQFGYDLDVRGNLVAIGEPYRKLDALNPAAGTAWIFRRRNAHHDWVVDQQLLRSAAEGFDTLGADVDLSDETVALGAPSARTAAGSDSGAIDLYDATEIVLTITPDSPAAGAPIDVEVHRGDPGQVFLIVVEDVNGAAFFLPVVVDVFGADHARAYQVLAPNPLLGVHVGLRAWKVSPTGALVHSVFEYVDV